MSVIAHVIVGLNRGGAEMMLRRLVEANLSFGGENEHIVISLSDLGFHGPFLQERGIAVYALGMRSPLKLFSAWGDLIRLFKKLKPDIVQTWMVHSDLIGGVAARVAGVRHVIWGVRTTDYNVESRGTRAVRWLCARLSNIIPSKIVSAAQAALISSLRAGYPEDKFTVIPNGFDVDALRSNIGKGVLVREAVGIRSDTLVVGCLGRYNPAKDHANFVRAAGLLGVKYPDCRYLMVGDGLVATNSDLMVDISATGFAERFFLLGERSDPAACLNAMDIFVLSSRTEAFPNVLGEAMALGVPCVSTDVGDAGILLGDTGELVPPCDSPALARSIERLLTMSAADRNALGQRGCERVKHEFSIDAAVCRFNLLYSALAKGL